MKYSQLIENVNSGDDKVNGEVLQLKFMELYKLMNIKNEGNLQLINEFISLNPGIAIGKDDVNYLHEKLTGMTLEELNEENVDDIGTQSDEVDEVESDKDSDACQILYSPHKKTPKIVPIQDKADPIARELFPNPMEQDLTKDIFNEPVEKDMTRDIFDVKPVPDHDMTRDIFNIKHINFEETSLQSELDEKRIRVTELEKVLMELQTYIQDLNEFTEKEIDKLRVKYENKVLDCESQISDIGERISTIESQLGIGKIRYTSTIFQFLIVLIIIMSIMVSIYLTIDKIEPILNIIKTKSLKLLNSLSNHLHNRQTTYPSFSAITHLIELQS